MAFPWTRKSRRVLPAAKSVTVDELLTIVSEHQSSISSLMDLIRHVANDAREAKAECRVLKLVVASLIAHVADETSQQQTLDIVLGAAERIVTEMEAEFGSSGAYRETTQEIREGAEARLPKPS